MNAQHTRGPWHRNIPPATKYPTVFAGRNTHIAVVQTTGLSPEEVEGNIRLITAAPWLAEACQAVAGVYAGCDDMPRYARRCINALQSAGIE